MSSLGLEKYVDSQITEWARGVASNVRFSAGPTGHQVVRGIHPSPLPSQYVLSSSSPEVFSETTHCKEIHKDIILCLKCQLKIIYFAAFFSDNVSLRPARIKFIGFFFFQISEGVVFSLLYFFRVS